MRTTTRALVLAAAFALLAGSVQAADIVTDLQADFDAVSGKLVSLAEAIPADEFGWRPAEGVRSVSESLMHVAAANYFFPTLLGEGMPEGVNPRGFESEYTTQEDAVRVLQESIENMKAVLAKASDMDLSGEVSFAGQTMSKTGFLHFAISHSHEHLGQMIAYARSIGVTPPWSQ